MNILKLVDDIVHFRHKGLKRYSSHNFQDIITSFGHKVDMTIYMLTWYRFFDKCILRGLIDKKKQFYQ